MKPINEHYFQLDDGMKQNTITDILESGEDVLWQAKPKRSAYIWGSILNSLLPFAILWLLFDGLFIFGMLSTDPAGAALAIIIPFFAFHLIPVWLYIGKIIQARLEYKNIEYYITQKRIILRSGVIGIDFKSIYFTQISKVNLKVGIVDRIFKVGDIYIVSDSSTAVLYDISNPYQMYSKLEKIVVDVQTDIHYPNALRPDTNPGYKTKLNNTEDK